MNRSKDSNQNIAKTILKIRQDNKLSQEQFAEIVGVTRQAVSRWEMGISAPNINTLILMSEKFNIQVDEMLKSRDVDEKNDNKTTPPKKNKNYSITFLLIGILGLISTPFFAEWQQKRNMELFKTAYEHSYDYIFEYPLSIILILALMFIGLGTYFTLKKKGGDWMKKMISFLTVLVLSIVTMLPVKVMAAEYPHRNSEVKHVNLLSDKTEYEIQPRTDGYYYWKVDSKTNQGTTYGSWRLGPQGAGPGTVTVNKTDTVTNTISGSYTSTGDISASLGVTIGKSQSYSVQYSLPVPSGKTYQIKYRPLYTKYKVVQRQYYKIDGYSSATNNTKTCYVNVFYDWGFSYNVI